MSTVECAARVWLIIGYVVLAVLALGVLVLAASALQSWLSSR